MEQIDTRNEEVIVDVVPVIFFKFKFHLFLYIILNYLKTYINTLLTFYHLDSFRPVTVCHTLSILSYPFLPAYT